MSVLAALKEFPKADSEPGTQKAKEDKSLIHCQFFLWKLPSFIHSTVRERQELSERGPLWGLKGWVGKPWLILGKEGASKGGRETGNIKSLNFNFETLSSLMKEDFDSCNHDTIHVLFIISCTVHSYLPQTNSSLLRSLLECLVVSFSLMWRWLICLWFPWRRFSRSCFQPPLSYIFILCPAACTGTSGFSASWAIFVDTLRRCPWKWIWWPAKQEFADTP